MSDISPPMQKIVSALLHMKEGTNKALSKRVAILPQNTSKYLKELSKNGCVFLLRSEGKERYYAVSEWVKWISFE